MNSQLGFRAAGVRRIPVRLRRRLVLLAAYGVAAIGIALTLPAGAQATRPVSPANAAAADAEFVKAKNLYDLQKYADAQMENEKALQLDPTNKDALLLRRVLADKVTSGGGATTGTATTTSGGGRPGVLNAQQIAVIRVLESSPDERNIRGKIDPKVLDEFWNDVEMQDPLVMDKSAQARTAFISPQNFAQQLQRIKDSHQQKYIEQVQMSTDPAVMSAFRTSVQTFVLQNCATSECHGGEKGGKFRLVTSIIGPGAPTAEQQLYTNFYIMAMYSNKDGKMIDRDTPERSLFLQYSLPWTMASVKHPKVDVRKTPAQIMLDWVRRLAFPEPNYGITFELPGGAKSAPAATAPASQPK